MASKPVEVWLPERVLARCREQGQRIVENYKRNLSPRSLSVSSRGAQRNPELQALGKMAECAFCLFCGMSPFRASFGSFADDGSDVKAFGRSFDVKYSVRGRLLIWPVNKRHFFHETSADSLAFVRGAPPNFQVVGVITKDRFDAEREEAAAGNPLRLDPGTWFVSEGALDDPCSIYPRRWNPWRGIT